MRAYSIFLVWVQRRDKIMEIWLFILCIANCYRVTPLAWHHASKSEELCQVHGPDILFGTLQNFLGISPNNFIDVYLFFVKNGWWSYCTLLHKRELSSVFPLPEKKTWKEEHSTKSPLHVFFIWCEKGTKSTFCRGDDLSKPWELWGMKKPTEYIWLKFEIWRSSARVLPYPPAKHLCTQWS